MHEYELDIDGGSRWITATASEAAKCAGLYATEAGNFTAGSRYFTRRDGMEGYLLLYTVGGTGMLKAPFERTLRSGEAVLIDCQEFHEYGAAGDVWQFYWIHFSGAAAPGLYELLDTAGRLSGRIPGRGEDFERIMELAERTEIAAVSELSLRLHSVIDAMVKSGQELPEPVLLVREFIKNHYREQITIDDMTSAAHVSKYHLIRLFKREAGVTPYHSLLLERVNAGKILLRTTDMPVGRIAFEVGFLDESNFISQFKRLTGKKPTQYRRDFG